MNWKDIKGQNATKSILTSAIKQNRVGHALIFRGENGSGVLPLALAFAQDLLCKNSPESVTKVQNFQHLDLHFSFPILLSSSSSDLSENYIKDFLEMMKKNPYSDYEDWLEKIEAKGKQLNFSVKEASSILEKFSIKSFEGGYKVLILWAAQQCSVKVWNTLLKFVEEPPENTVLILITDSLEEIIDTIKSRCQIYDIPKLDKNDVVENLILDYNCSKEKANLIAQESDGDWNIALKKINQTENTEFEEMFILWVRSAFMVKKDPGKLNDIHHWSLQVKSWTKDRQLHFLGYCSDMFRLALMQNYGMENLVYKKLNLNQFKWENFADRIHGKNVALILEEINLANIHLRRNGNEGIIWMDLGIKLSRFIHLKPI